MSIWESYHLTLNMPPPHPPKCKIPFTYIKCTSPCSNSFPKTVLMYQSCMEIIYQWLLRDKSYLVIMASWKNVSGTFYPHKQVENTRKHL